MKEFTVKGDSHFEGGNVFITNGKDGLDELNGKGNLIVGGKSADPVANPGSHNVIIEFDNKYSAFGGLVAGHGNVFITNGKDGLDELNGKGNLIVGGKSADAVANP